MTGSKLRLGAILAVGSFAASQAVGWQVNPDVTGTRKAGDVVIEQASLSTPETGTVNFELGTMYVPENRADPKSRIIGVGYVCAAGGLANWQHSERASACNAAGPEVYGSGLSTACCKTEVTEPLRQSISPG